MTRIDVVTDHTGSGFIVAVDSSDRPPGAGYDWAASATAVVVGQLSRAMPTLSRPARWTAWLWKQAGQYGPLGEHSETVKAADPAQLAAALRKRLDEKGAWWQ